MRFYITKYSAEIVEFLSTDTLKKIDYGVLDLSKIRNHELKEVLLFFEELLSMELKINYSSNNTGIFRVHIVEDRYCYSEFGYVIEADSLCSLRELVLSENRIWYVFDEFLAEKLIG